MPHNRDPERDTASRACDACRTRKVRCDKGSPCSNCRSSGSICRTSTTHNDEPRSRVMISKEYEKKIDRIGDRLVRIEELLQRQPAATAPSPHRSAAEGQFVSGVSVSQSKTALNYPSPTGLTKRAASIDYAVCDATTGAHSAVASRMIEQAVGNSPDAYQDSELAAALKSLKGMVAKIEDIPSSTEFVRCHWSLEEAEPVELPSEAEIDRLLQKAHGSLSLAFSPGLTVPLLKEKCNSVFKQCKEANAIRRVHVYGVIWHLCNEYSGTESDPAFAERCRGLSRVFTARLGQAINELELIMPATAEAASALVVAAGVAVALFKPFLALSLSSKAASILISLGYHRLSTMQLDTERERQSKILLFWMAYWLDTSFSVRFGHAPEIHHCYITVPRLGHGSILPSSFVDVFNYCTRIGSLQCKVVEQLYSPLALQESVNERRKRASRLVEELQEAWDGREEAPSCVADEVNNTGAHLLFKESDAVMHYSTVALVQHATISVANGDSPALESARRALRLSVNAWKAYKHLPDFIWSAHCHWTLLNAPITPFTVTFCHIIAHPFTSNAELCLLADFVATLKDQRRFSDGMVKLYRLCDVFCKVATLYVQAKEREAGPKLDVQHSNTAADPEPAPKWIGQPAVNDIDEYLSTLGFAPPPDGIPDVFGSNAEFDASFLMDWMQGNSSLLGFLEHDLTFLEGPE